MSSKRVVAPPTSNTLALVITFSNSNFNRIDRNLHDLVMITVIARNYIIRKILVSQGSFVDILFLSTVRKMQFSESSLNPYNGNLVSFLGWRVNVQVMFSYKLLKN